MQVIVVGLGSMGKRRIRLLQQIDSDIDIIGIDAKPERRQEAEEKFGIKTTVSIGEACSGNKPLGALVCTSPLSHAVIIEKCLNRDLNVFTEINLVSDRYSENMELAREKNLTLFLSSTFLYRDEIRYIQNEVEKAKSRLSYTYHVGQYLPDWHPWENYKDYFIGDARTSGCREIMAIDFPWLYKTFGDISSVKAVKSKKTDLKTTYSDSYLMLVEHKTGVQGTFVVDVVSRKAIRNFEVFGEDLYLTWDGSTDGLKKYDIDSKKEENINLYDSVDRQEGYAAFVVENAYRNELVAFMNAIRDIEKPVYGFEDDICILQMIDQIEKTGAWEAK